MFIHQFAEEVIPGGAKAMIEDRCLNHLDVVYGAHVLSNLPVGQVLFKEDYMMAAGDKFEIVIKGKGGHESSPHLAVDPVLIESQIVTTIQQIIASRINTTDPTVITVCLFDGAGRYNIIPDQVVLSGTVRTFSEEARKLSENHIRRIAEAACDGAGAECVVTYEYGYPSVCNNSEEALRVKCIGEKIVGKENISESPLQMAMEDFSYYLKEKPDAFFNVGGMNPSIQAVHPHHHPQFDVDEQSIILAGKMFISLVFDYLNSSH